MTDETTPPKRNPKGGPKRKPPGEARSARIVMQTTPREKAAIANRAAAAGVSISDYLRTRGLAGSAADTFRKAERRPANDNPVPNADLCTLITEVNRIGHNLNQLMPGYHLGRIPGNQWALIHDELRRLLARLAEMVDVE